MKKQRISELQADASSFQRESLPFLADLVKRADKAVAKQSNHSEFLTLTSSA